MRREAKTLLRKAIESLILSVDHFNRPWDCGRQEAVLILLDRTFELLMKSALCIKGDKSGRQIQKRLLASIIASENA